MVGMQMMVNSSTAAAMMSGSMAAATAGASDPMRPLAQVLSELLDALATLLAAELTLVNQA